MNAHQLSVRLAKWLLVCVALVGSSAPVFAAATVSAAVGKSATFSVVNDGTAPFTYQWRKTVGGAATDISGATGATYVIASVQTTDAGDYSVKISNSAGSTLSDTGTLQVAAAPATGGSSGSTGSGSGTGGTTGGTGGSSSTSGGTGSVSPTTSGGAGFFVRPAGVVLDLSGDIFVADANDHTIKKITPAGAVSVFAGSSGIVGSADGTGTAARFSQPAGLAIDNGGNLYVADSANATIRKITPLGVVTTLAGVASIRGVNDGTGATALFSSPTGLAIDAAGDLYVTDSTANTIRKITPAGAVTTVAGTPLARGELDGQGQAAQFNNPSGIAVDGAGNLFVADTFNDTIRKITPAGAVTTLAGSAGLSGTFDGTGHLALFNQPIGVAIDGSGNILVADSGNSTIRRISSAGTVTTLAGIAAISGFRDGAGSSALFNQPQALVSSAAGYIFVADTGNALIREIATDETVSTPVLSLAPAASVSTGGTVVGTVSGGGSSSTGGSSSSSSSSDGSNSATAGSASTGSSGGGGMEVWFALGILGCAGLARHRGRRARGNVAAREQILR